MVRKDAWYDFNLLKFIEPWYVVRKDAWYDFNLLKFIEPWYVALDMLYPGECSMCTWEESVFCCFGMECSINVN